MTPEINSWWGYVMKTTFKRIWEAELWFTSEKKKRKQATQRVISRLERKQLTAPLATFCTWTVALLQLLCGTQMPQAFIRGGPQMRFSFSACHVLLYFCQMDLFSSHNFISRIAKLPHLVDNRILFKKFRFLCWISPHSIYCRLGQNLQLYSMLVPLSPYLWHFPWK